MSGIVGEIELELESTTIELLDEDGAQVEVEVETYVLVEEETELILDVEGGAPGAPGAPGLSAYQLALLDGFVGTLDDFLESLRGTPGQDGEQGPPGVGYTPVVYFQSYAVSVWEFTHDFPYRPDVDVFDQNGELIEADVSFPTSTTVRVVFGFDMTGSIQLS